jgi:hypothetical protein
VRGRCRIGGKKCAKGLEGSASRAEEIPGEEDTRESELGVIESWVSTYFVIGAREILFCNDGSGKDEEAARRVRCSRIVPTRNLRHAVDKIRGAKIRRSNVAARLGVEPRQNESESFVLPLHHRAVEKQRRVRTPKRKLQSVRLEPAMGFEPATACLQNRCSTVELRRRKSTLRLPRLTGKKQNAWLASRSSQRNFSLSSLRLRETATQNLHPPLRRDEGWWLPGDSNPEPTD